MRSSTRKTANICAPFLCHGPEVLQFENSHFLDLVFTEGKDESNDGTWIGDWAWSLVDLGDPCMRRSNP